MKVLITGAHTKEAFISSGVLWVENIDFDMVGRDPLDIGFLFSGVPEGGKIKETVFQEIDFVKENSPFGDKFTHVLPFADLTRWALTKEELGKLGIKVIVNSFESIRTVNDYFNLYRKCRDNGITHPRTYKGNSEINFFPLVIKSRDKKDRFLVTTMRDVYNITAGRKDVLVQQHIPGVVSKVVFIRDWMMYAQCLSDYVMEIMETCPLETQKVIESFGLEFGTLYFITNDDTKQEYFVDAKPYVEWDFLKSGSFMLLNLLEKNNPCTLVPGNKIIKIPSLFLKEEQKKEFILKKQPPPLNT